MKDYAILRLPHGYYHGEVAKAEVSPALTTSSWEANNLLVEKPLFNNKRLSDTLAEHSSEIQAQSKPFAIDCYNKKIYTDGCTPTITTRVSGACNYFVVEPIMEQRCVKRVSS